VCTLRERLGVVLFVYGAGSKSFVYNDLRFNVTLSRAGDEPFAEGSSR